MTARVLLLGTHHFDNPGLDLINPVMDDVLAPPRQAEIHSLCTRLATFAPTKIAVERRDQAAVDADYAAAEWGRGEEHQIGMRLARMLGHSRVYAIDWNEDVESPDPVAYAQQYETDRFAAFQALLAEVAAENDHVSGPLTGMLSVLNSPESLRRTDRLYALVATFGRDADYPGAAYVSGWVRRNLIIFANLAAMAEPDDRIFVLYGAGHVPELARAIQSYGMTLEPVLPYLA